MLVPSLVCHIITISIYAIIVYRAKLSLTYPHLFFGCLCFFCNDDITIVKRSNYHYLTITTLVLLS